MLSIQVQCSERLYLSGNCSKVKSPAIDVGWLIGRCRLLCWCTCDEIWWESRIELACAISGLEPSICEHVVFRHAAVWQAEGRCLGGSHTAMQHSLTDAKAETADTIVRDGYTQAVE